MNEKDTIKNGVYEYYYEDEYSEQIKWRGNYRNGLKHGLVEAFHWKKNEDKLNLKFNDKKNNYPMPVNVSKKFKKKSELVGIVKEKEEEAKISLKGLAKTMYVDPLKKMPDNIRGKNMDEYQEYLTEVLAIMSIFSRRYA